MTKSADSPFQTILVINSTERDRSEAALVTENETFIESEPVRAQELPTLITKLLARSGLKIEDIKALAVFNQPGSLTGTRVGVTVANTLAWDRTLPIIEVSAPSLEAALKDLRRWSEHQYVKIAAVKAVPLTTQEKPC
ncbi:MAG TPA: hypothetical protein VMQ44_02885 [Candidatus Saccharimonadales bacterium]|nr:hypothetical protein [Candidatus Saccharimonadales bacterium]